ncbi:hypothetical protein KUA19_05625 [Catellatospora sp. NEAU-YM18]|nr:hypothetical protein [Catellatospora tritici]
MEALIIEPYTGTLAGNGAPRLVLVPAPGADLGVAAEYQNKIDGRPSIILLSLDSILESLEQVKLGLSTYAGARFIDGVPVIEATAGTS